MPTCPNCGSYIPLGNHSCSCGTTIGYDDDSEEYDDYPQQPINTRQRIQNEYPYEYDFFNDLYHMFIPKFTLDRMYRELKKLEEKYDAKFVKGDVSGRTAFLNLLKEDKYFDAILRTSYHMDNEFDRMEIMKDTITPDFSKLYASEEIKKIISEMEEKTNTKFHLSK